MFVGISKHVTSVKDYCRRAGQAICQSKVGKSHALYQYPQRQEPFYSHLKIKEKGNNTFLFKSVLSHKAME